MRGTDLLSSAAAVRLLDPDARRLRLPPTRRRSDAAPPPPPAGKLAPSSAAPSPLCCLVALRAAPPSPHLAVLPLSTLLASRATPAPFRELRKYAICGALSPPVVLAYTSAGLRSPLMEYRAV
jgi:hypothetical protein